jgi:hypothetical protein
MIYSDNCDQFFIYTFQLDVGKLKYGLNVRPKHFLFFWCPWVYWKYYISAERFKQLHVVFWNSSQLLAEWLADWRDCEVQKLQQFLSVRVNFNDLLIQGWDLQNGVIVSLSPPAAAWWRYLSRGLSGSASWHAWHSRRSCWGLLARDDGDVFAHTRSGVEVIAQAPVVLLDHDPGVFFTVLVQMRPMSGVPLKQPKAL